MQALAWLPAPTSAPTHQGRRRQDGICAEGDAADMLKAEEGRVSLRGSGEVGLLHYPGGKRREGLLEMRSGCVG